MFPRSFFLQLIEKDFSEFTDFLKNANDEEIRQLLTELHPADIADIVENSEEAEQTRLMSLLDNSQAAEVLSLVEEHMKSEVVEAISEEKLPEIIDEMDSDDATDILEELPEAEVKEILDAMPQEESAPMRQLLNYEEDSAGGLMQTELVAVSPETKLFEAAEKVRKDSKKVTNVGNLYVVSAEGTLKGVVPIQALVLEDPEKSVSEVMKTDYFFVDVNQDQEKVAEIFRKYDLISLPVVDQQHKLLGRIMIDDIVDVIQEEASEDIYRLAGVDIEEHVADSAFRSIRLRFPWLLFNLGTAIMASLVVSLFETTIQQVVLLAVFMPIVAGMGGNAGTQSLAVITRSLALGELNFSNAKRALIKESLSGLLNGIFMGLIMGGITYLWTKNSVLALVLGLAMVANMLIATFTGTAIPLLLRWIKVDPALASGVIVTTFTDMVGFFAFLGLATVFLKYLVS
ncbi:MAG: magnesium transporter [Deltaproteobacteria bacterium]|nr:magnesium transporter [Deltaproteobacteria bacterium]